MNKQTDSKTYDQAPNDNNTDTSVVKEKVSEVTAEAQQQVSALSQQAKAEAKSSLQTQKEMAAQELHGVAHALRQTSSNLREQDQTMFAQYSNQVADRVERVSTYLEEHDLDELMGEAENFAHRQPELFIGGAFTLGLLAARFLKSSSTKATDNLPMHRRETAVTNYDDNNLGSDYPYGGVPRTSAEARTRA